MPTNVGAAPPPRSPERQRLADAIERRDAADFQLNRVNDALQKLDDSLFERLEPTCLRAREALDEAIAAAPERLVAEALGELDDPAAGPSVAEAEGALKIADTALLEARKARSLLREEHRAREHAADQAKRAVDAAVADVVADDPAKRALVSEFFLTGRRLLRLSRLMRTIGIGSPRVSAVDLGLVLRITDVAPPGEPDRSLYRPDPEWSAALSALHGDADAPLPGLPEPEADADAVDGKQAA